MSIRPAEFDGLLARRRHMLTGRRLDSGIPEVKAALANVEATARQFHRSLQRSPDRTILWKDLAGLKPFSNAISSQYLRLQAMALAWATPGQSLHGRADLLRDIKSGLAFMEAHEFNARTGENGNWYDFEIAAPLRLTDILVFLGDEVTREERRRYLAPVERFDSDPDVIDPNHRQRSTAANRTDKAMADLIEGVLLGDERPMTIALDAIKTVFPVASSGDGFYADGSFVFHGYFPYTGNYGVVLLSDVADVFHLLQGSRWDLGTRLRATAVRWAEDSFAPLVFKGAMMDMVRGRLISYRSSPSHAVGHRTIAAFLRLAQTAPSADARRLRAGVKRWLQDDTSRSYADGLPLDLIGDARRLLDSRSIAAAEPQSSSRVFASMDRAVHDRPWYAVGISMHSTRIQNYESINGDDLHGWHTSDGMLYLHDADLLQFDEDFWPTVDPQRLPGTTAIADSHPSEGQFGGSSAVGGASLGGYGAVMMQLDVFGGRLRAKKSWFLFDDEVVALGADIRSVVAGKRIATIVENRRLRAARAKALVRGPAGAWACLPASPATAPIGYQFPTKSPIRAQRVKRTGSWRDIDTGLPPKKLSASYQTIWIDHGVKPKRGNYAYVLLPGRDAAATKKYAAEPAVRIVENTAEAQAVAHSELGITAVSFWKPGRTVDGIAANAVCSVIVRRVGGRLLIAVSDPTQTSGSAIRLTIDARIARTLSADRGIKIKRRATSVQLAVDVVGSAGRTFRAAFALKNR